MPEGAEAGVVRKHLKLIALLLALTLVGHDGAMAGDAHGSPAARADSTGQHHHDAHSGHLHDTAPADRTDPESECGPVMNVSPHRPDSSHPILPTTLLATPPDQVNALILPAVRAIEPDHPPDIRRALLQVFLN